MNDKSERQNLFIWGHFQKYDSFGTCFNLQLTTDNFDYNGLLPGAISAIICLTLLALVYLAFKYPKLNVLRFFRKSHPDVQTI